MRAIVTGANRGIGLEFVRQLLARGDHVEASARAPDRAPELRALEREAAGRLRVHCCDVGDGASVEAFGRALPDLAEEYEQAGVRAWTVWVPVADRVAAELLAAAGHKLDGTPEAMGTSLAAVPEAEVAEESADSSLVGPINDAAYGLAGSFTAALAPGLGHPGMRVYLSAARPAWSHWTWARTATWAWWPPCRRPSGGGWPAG